MVYPLAFEYSGCGLRMRSFPAILKITAFLFMPFLLCQCTPVADSDVQAAAPVQNPYTLPVESSLALADTKTGGERAHYQLLAAGRAIQDGDWKRGQDILDSLEPPSAAAADEATILRAKIAAFRSRPSEVLAELGKVRNVTSLPPYYQERFHALLARAYEAEGRTLEAATQRITLEGLLTDDAARNQNRRALWKALNALPPAELETAALESASGSRQQGWMQLALIPRKYSGQSQALLKALTDWEAAFPGHPGRRIVADNLAQMPEKLLPPARSVALLLPVSGALSGPGEAVRDGFIAAAQNAPQKVDVKVYDTTGADVAALYQKAIEDGAGYVVGPLAKADVAIVAALEHPVPTLLLNELDIRTDANAWQLGLSPVNEARQVAKRARERGLSRALIIAPDNAWGNDVSAAFADAFVKTGGTVTDSLHYAAKDDLSERMRNFLQYHEKDMPNAKPIGGRMPKIHTRREDFDMIFLLAYPSMARQIMPLIKYYYAGNVPVYATSSVYAGSSDPKKDRDLDGIVFCDMPWVFANNLGNRNWPEQLNSYNRLYALGMDSFNLSSQLNELMLFPSMGINNQSGVLYLNPRQQIGRSLVFGQFRQGRVQMNASV
ncbi:penicillin-binding protein activator [Legionella geestiana]|nr:penicillin-binding protein activator [Legionella geestiana]